VEKTSIFPDEEIHIMLECALHLHGHQNKVVPLMKLLYSQILAMAINSIVALANQRMAFKNIVFYVELIITTLTTKTWFFQIM
jgi:chromate transport protein ChrA